MIHTTAPDELTCPHCQGSLARSAASLRCTANPEHEFPILHDIPRFVPIDNYAASFGLQWNTFRKTQLDSFTGRPISKERLERILGAPLESLRGKRVVEAGCGAGRFTELLVASGAKVVAADISTAVEANLANCRHLGAYTIVQADIRHLPIRPQTFDVVLCIGVIQHTPDPEETIACLARYLAPGGRLYIDHYSEVYPETAVRKAIRKRLVQMSPGAALAACKVLTSTLWPTQRFLWKHRSWKGLTRAYHAYARLSPLVDYQGSFPDADDEFHRTLTLLDTHDTLTDRYKHLRTPDQLRSALAAAGLTEIEVWRGGNGVEARALRP